MLAFAGAAQTVFLALFLARVALHEAGLLEWSTQVGSTSSNRFGDGLLDSVNLAAKPATASKKSRWEVFRCVAGSCVYQIPHKTHVELSGFKCLRNIGIEYSPSLKVVDAGMQFFLLVEKSSRTHPGSLNKFVRTVSFR